VNNGAEVKNRRPLKSRDTWWARLLMGIVAKTPLKPNTISVIGIFFALGGFCVYFAVGTGQGHPFLLFVAAACIQFRLLCNMMDGLVAVEAGKSEPTGILYNEAPDRLEDALFLLGAGIATGNPFYGVDLGWLCVALALGTAYVRVLGGSLGLVQDFCGPMAKQHRMFFLTLGSLGGGVEFWLRGGTWILTGALVIIAVGAFLTLIRRLLRISAQLKARS
jgi:phosphatidylglycerophosphate synthase